MEQHLFIVLFFTGVIPSVQSVPRKYYLIQQEKTWSDAQAYCQAEYTDLAIIESNDNMVQLQNEMQRQQFTSTAWIGMYNDINSWRWSYGNEPLGIMKLWFPGEPNNSNGHEACVIIGPNGWFDGSCTNKLPFVCFDDTNTGILSYIYIANQLTWQEAQNYCRTHYTDLTNSRTQKENSDITALISGATWIGLFRDTWKWIDQTSYSVIPWMPGKPDNALQMENCGYLYNSQAVDAQCSDKMPFFCYRVIKRQQIARFKIQTSQDANNPAVMSTLLLQIKQTLKAHGMAENITVKWREQPEGKVFHKEKEKSTTEK